MVKSALCFLFKDRPCLYWTGRRASSVWKESDRFSLRAKDAFYAFNEDSALQDAEEMKKMYPEIADSNKTMLLSAMMRKGG